MKFKRSSAKWLTVHNSCCLSRRGSIRNIVESKKKEQTSHLPSSPFRSECFGDIFFKKKNFGGHQSFFVGPLISQFYTLEIPALGFNTRVDPLFVCFTCVQWVPQMHLRCYTCWPLDDQHGSRAFLIHVLAQVYSDILVSIHLIYNLLSR